jgi:predicted RNA-binding protein associated with RNAse of E/G family
MGEGVHALGRKVKTSGKNMIILSDLERKNYLEYFQKHFVLVPADKANNNILVVCKNYYLDVVLKELARILGLAHKLTHLVALTWTI